MVWVQESVLKVFESLISEDLLRRYLGRNAQHCNESYNRFICKIAPKSKFAGREVVEIASWFAACAFNEGSTTYFALMYLLGIKIGETATTCAEHIHECRISLTDTRSMESSKKGQI